MKVDEGNDYPTCERACAELRIHPGDTHPERITERLGIAPTRVNEKGATRTTRIGTIHTVPHNVWSLSSEDHVRSRDLRHHLDWLLDRLAPAAGALVELQSEPGTTMSIHCNWWSVHGAGGPIVEPEQLRRMAELGLELGFDFSYYGEDEDEDDPPVSEPPVTGPFPIGQVIGDDRRSFRITGRLRGDAEVGQFYGIDRDTNTGVLVTVAPPLPKPLDQIERELTLRVDRVSPLLGVFPLSHEGRTSHAMVEVAHRNQPLTDLSWPLDPTEAKRLAGLLAMSVQHAAGKGLTLVGIRPETTSVIPAPMFGLGGTLPRAEVFWGMAGVSDKAANLFRYRYAAPEVVFGQPASPAADVFSVCALLAHIASGEHPFVGDSQEVQITSMRDGRRRAWTGPPELESIIAAGLAADPGRRPSPAKLFEALYDSTRSKVARLLGFIGLGGGGDDRLELALEVREKLQRQKAKLLAQDTRDFPTGETLGAYTVGEDITGERWCGRYHGRDRKGAPVLITVAGRQTVRLSKLRRTLDMKCPGIARLLYLGRLSGKTGEGSFDAMVEQRPPGQPASELARLDPRAGMRLAVRVAEIVGQAHQRALTIGALRPELIYVTGGAEDPLVSGIVPRGEHFIITASRPNFGIPNLFETVYQAPEVMADGAPPSPAADVFTLSAMCAEWVGGRHPFEGEIDAAQMMAIDEGRRVDLDLPADVAGFLDRGLARAPGQRPSIDEWIDQARGLLEQPIWGSGS